MTPSSPERASPAGSTRSSAPPASASPPCGGRRISQIVGEHVHPGLDPESRVRRASRRLSGIGRLELTALATGLVLVVAVAVLPVFLTHGPLDLVDLPLKAPGAAHLLGTDEGGRDVFPGVVSGMRTSLWAAAVVIASGVLIGGTVGLVAGIAGGIVDGVLMRLTDL